MYYDLKFPYRISAEAGLAHDGEGNNVEAYLRIKIGNCKKAVTSEEYDEMHIEQRENVAGMLKKGCRMDHADLWRGIRGQYG